MSNVTKIKTANRVTKAETNTQADKLLEALKSVDPDSPLYNDLMVKYNEVTALTVREAQGPAHTEDQLKLADDIADELSENQRVISGNIWAYDEKRGVWSQPEGGEAELAAHVQNHLREYYTKTVTSSIVSSVSKMTLNNLYKPGSKNLLMGQPTNVVVAKNCELTLEDEGWVVSPHNREAFRVTGVDTVYEADAKCPRFDQWLDDTFANTTNPETLKQRVLELMGMTLLSSNRDAQIMFLKGAGRNGKGTLIKIMEMLLGSDSVAVASPSQFKDDYILAGLAGKLLVYCGDVAVGDYLADGKVKEISGGDTITGRHIYGKHFSFEPTCSIWMAGNNGLRTKDTSHGMLSRINIIPFVNVISDSDKDTTIFEVFMKERSGILNRLLEAYAAKNRRGNFTPSVDMDSEKKLWKDDNDMVQEYINEHVEVVTTQSKVKHSYLYGDFRRWAEEAGYKGYPTNKDVRKAVALVLAGTEAYCDDKSARTWNWYNISIRSLEGA